MNTKDSKCCCVIAEVKICLCKCIITNGIQRISDKCLCKKHRCKGNEEELTFQCKCTKVHNCACLREKSQNCQCEKNKQDGCKSKCVETEENRSDTETCITDARSFKKDDYRCVYDKSCSYNDEECNCIPGKCTCDKASTSLVDLSNQ